MNISLLFDLISSGLVVFSKTAQSYCFFLNRANILAKKCYIFIFLAVMAVLGEVIGRKNSFWEGMDVQRGMGSEVFGLVSAAKRVFSAIEEGRRVIF